MATAKQAQLIPVLADVGAPDIGPTRNPFARSEVEYYDANDDATRLRSARPLDDVKLRAGGVLEVVTGLEGKRWLLAMRRDGFGYEVSASRQGVVYISRLWIRDLDVVRVARVVKTFALNHWGELVASGEVES